MCVVSMVMDEYSDRWRRRRDRWYPSPPPFQPSPYPFPREPRISQEEVEELKRLLERAREYDKRHNEPDCELDEKRQTLKKLAEDLGVEITFQ